MDRITMYSVLCGNTQGKIVLVEGKPSANGRWLQVGQHAMRKIGTDVFHTEAEAEAVARKNAAKRIASLEKTLAKMRANPFAQPMGESDRG